MQRRQSKAFMDWYHRTPEIIRDVLIGGYALVDVEERNSVQPAEFPIPLLERRKKCKKHEYVSLLALIRIDTNDDEAIALDFIEVVIRNCISGWYHGSIVSCSGASRIIHIGKNIDFEPRHILAIVDVEIAN